MKTKLTMPLFSLLVIVLCLSSCDSPVGLGVKVNLVPPTVTIDSPNFMENVGSTFTIEGTATDEEGIVLLAITVEYVTKEGEEWKQEFRSERGVWSSRNTAHPDWEDTEDNGVWTALDRKNIFWSVEAVMPENTPDGEYLISVSVENSVHKPSTIQQRRVVKDASSPVVTILAPVLELDDYEETFDKYTTWKDPSILNRLHSGEIAVQYEIKDDFSFASLYFQLTDDTETIYYNRDANPVTNMGWSGKVTIPGKKIKDADGNPITGKKYLQLISSVTDEAGNKSLPRSHGWLVWWPDADKPWVDGFGVENQLEAQSQSRVYPGSVIQGQAYDNKSVYSVSYKIYIIDDGGNEQKVDDGVVYNVPLEDGSEPSAFFNWTITSPTKCAVYKIVIDCEDKQGNEGEQVTRYFYVYDVDAPSISVTKPAAQETLFGDVNGNFTVEGIVRDGVEPKRLTLVRLNPNAIDESRVLYQSAEYTGWNKPGENDDKWEDDKGNLIWELDLGQDTGRVEKTFSKSLNLFNDLSIGKGTGKFPLATQSFIFRVEGDSGRAITLLHSVRGDIQPPSLSIDRIIAKRAGAKIQDHTIDELKNEPMDFLLEGDEIYLSGKWNDDSAAAWGTADKAGPFTVSWNGVSVNNAAFKYDGSSGTWEAGPISYQGEGSGDITAELLDIGNNIARTSFSAIINTNEPKLRFVTSDASDGAYNAGKVINIYYEFNKEVAYTGSDIPYLTLNNEGTAYRTDGDGTMRHKFTYTVEEGDDTPSLNVTGIVFGSGTWEGGGEADMNIPAGKYLSDTKKIKIDTTPPAITRVESMNDAGYYRAGSTINLRLYFDENIVFNRGTGGAQLGLDDLAGSATDGKTDVLNQNVSGQNFLLFTYKAADGHNTPKLSVTELTLNSGASITDEAGNGLTVFSIPAGGNIADGTEGKTIIIDTTKPNPPILSHAGGTFKEAQSFTVSGGETNALVEYSINGSWHPYTGEVTIQNVGSYTIRAQQTDLAGNVSDNTTPVTITIEENIPLLRSFSGSSPSGTYKTSDKINIILNLSKTITVTGDPELNLNAGNNTAVASFDGTNRNNTSTLKFNYQIVAGDDVDPLEITSIDLAGVTLTAADGKTVTTELRTDGKDGSENSLSDYTRITIDTTKPEFNGAVLLGDTLTLNFSKKIYKGSGSITLTQQDDYLAPAVLTKDEYNRFGGASVLGDYYTVGTNGTDAAGVADLTEKYILNYAYNTDGSNDIDNTEKVTDVLKERNADKVIIPVTAGAVRVNNNSLEVTLSGNYAFNVKGVNYALTFDEGLVRDDQNNPVIAKNGTSTTVKPSGVNRPFIRVQKERGSITAGTPVRADQPRNAQFKIDCQTPGVTITYASGFTSTPAVTTFNSPPTAPTVTVPTSADTSYTGNNTGSNPSLDIINNLQNTDYNGYLCAIRARVAGSSEDAYEVAARSVIQFVNPPLPANPTGKTTQLWLRGGDSKNGDSLTPGFPLSWDENDYDGIRLMTANGSTWYWISWEVNAKAYFHFIAGTTTTVEEAANGPLEWSWSKDTWSFQQDKYPLYPGGSVSLATNSNVPGSPTGTYSFPAFTGKRY